MPSLETPEASPSTLLGASRPGSLWDPLRESDGLGSPTNRGAVRRGVPGIPRPRPLILMILDGFGISFIEQGNAIRAAKMENLSTYLRSYPCAALRASGIEVGLPWGEVGNSEVGHKNMGSGRVIYQRLPQITSAIEDGSFFRNVAFQETLSHLRERPEASLHLAGLVSNGGVHSHLNHLLALLEFARVNGIGKKTFLHAFLDGDDAPPVSAGQYLSEVEKKIQSTGAGRVASMVGRHYAMDRDNNWNRTQAAYDLIVSGSGAPYPSWQAALEAAYEDRKTDNAVLPSVIVEHDAPVRTVQDGDAIIFFNFRADRARQLVEAFVSKHFDRFPAKGFRDLSCVTMTDYGTGFPVTVAFPEEWAEISVGRVIADAGFRQLRITESEKYAHVTYFFNSGREAPFSGEDRVFVPSPKVKNYAETPHMSAGAITDRVVQEIRKGKYDVIVMNYVNPDMLAHTGNFEATVAALQFLDTQIASVVETALTAGGAVLLTCDHGHAEELLNPQTGEVATDHTANPVPIAYISREHLQVPPKDEAVLDQILSSPLGVLADVGPTVLEILGLEKPPQMTARSLLWSLR